MVKGTTGQRYNWSKVQHLPLLCNTRREQPSGKVVCGKRPYGFPITVCCNITCTHPLQMMTESAQLISKVGPTPPSSSQPNRAYTTGAQITLLRGKRFSPPSTAGRNEASILVQFRTMYFALRLFEYTVCYRPGCQCFSLLRTLK